MYKAIIQGYDSVASLSDDEVAALPYMVFTIQMIFIAYLANTPSYKDALKTNMDMLVWLWENRHQWI